METSQNKIKQVNYLSVCSGIESATVAWHPLGWKPVAFSEIEPFPCAVLAHHWPDVPNLGDMTLYEKWKLRTKPDVLVGGTPCQSFSIAGLREGLDNVNGQLMLTYVEIAAKWRPKWLVWENVPGCLSSAKGEDFATFLGTLTGGKVDVPLNGWSNSGVVEGITEAYGVAWRVLDAQYFGVAQRRRRVFVIGYLGDWRRAAAVLFEQASMCGNTAPRREKAEGFARKARTSLASGSETTGTIMANCATKHWLGNQEAFTGNYHVIHGTQDPDTLHEKAHTLGLNAGQENVIAIPIQDQATRHLGKNGGKRVGKGNGLGIGKEHDPAPTLTKGDKHAVAFTQNQRNELRELEISGALSGNASVKQVTLLAEQITSSQPEMQVRRLTPRECERLQGFPDNHTLIPNWRMTRTPDDLHAMIHYLRAQGFSEEDAVHLAYHPDGHRYKACGNSMAVPVIRWLGERIEEVERVCLS